MQKKILALFFTKGISVEIWKEKGLFEREKQIYDFFIKENTFDIIYWFTYGCKDESFHEYLNTRIKIVAMPCIFNSLIGKFFYSFFMPFIKRKQIKQCSVLKTNQIWGSWTAIISKYLFNKKLYLRSGYLLSHFYQFENKNFSFFKSVFIEKIAFKMADFSSVTSQKAYNYILKKYKVQNVDFIPNFVDVELFKPLKISKTQQIIYVGRLSKEKNLFNLILAISQTSYSLDLYGEGYLKEELINYSKSLNCSDRIAFKGKVENNKLPEILNTYQVYVLSSFHEGMPKTLLEAMSCGLACLGTNVQGISEVIENKQNGILCEPDANSLKQGIEVLMQNEEFRKKLGENARKNIIKEYSLEQIFIKEKKILENLQKK